MKKGFAMYGKISAIVAAGVLAAACAQGYGQDPRTQRALGGAAIGGAVGAGAGAIIDDNTTRGALIGGAAGAALGAGVGAATTPSQRTGPGGAQMYFDQRAQRYFYVDQRTGRTYWENGQLRG